MGRVGFNRPLQVAYVDLKSAFDSVDRQALCKALRGVGMPQNTPQLDKGFVHWNDVPGTSRGNGV